MTTLKTRVALTQELGSLFDWRGDRGYDTFSEMAPLLLDELTTKDWVKSLNYGIIELNELEERDGDYINPQDEKDYQKAKNTFLSNIAKAGITISI